MRFKNFALFASVVVMAGCTSGNSPLVNFDSSFLTKVTTAGSDSKMASEKAIEITDSENAETPAKKKGGSVKIEVEMLADGQTIQARKKYLAEYLSWCSFSLDSLDFDGPMMKKISGGAYINQNGTFEPPNHTFDKLPPGFYTAFFNGTSKDSDAQFITGQVAFHLSEGEEKTIKVTASINR